MSLNLPKVLYGVTTQLIWNLSIEGMMGAQSRSYPHGIPKVSTFTHCNKLTSRRVSKPLMGLTTLSQALICTPTPNLMGMIWSKSMISQVSQMVTYYLWWVLWYFKEFKNAKLDKWQKMLLSLRSNPQTMSPYIHNCDNLCTRTDHHMLLSYGDCSLF